MVDTNAGVPGHFYAQNGQFLVRIGTLSGSRLKQNGIITAAHLQEALPRKQLSAEAAGLFAVCSPHGAAVDRIPRPRNRN
jgi:hypothetical protein